MAVQSARTAPEFCLPVYNKLMPAHSVMCRNARARRAHVQYSTVLILEQLTLFAAGTASVPNNI